MKNLLKPLTKSVSIPLKLALAASTTDSAIQKNIFGSGMTTMIISNEEINDIMKIIKSLKQAGLLKKRVSNTDENKTKAQKDAILEMSLGTLSVTLLRSLLTSKRVIRACGSVIRAGGGRIRATKDFFILPHPLPNFETQRYYQNGPKFYGVYSRNKLPKIKDGAHLINLDEYKSIETHWIVLYVNGDNVTYFDNFGVEHIPKRIKKFIGNKNIKPNIHRMQANDSIMSKYFCIEIIDLILEGKSLLELGENKIYCVKC